MGGFCFGVHQNGTGVRMYGMGDTKSTIAREDGQAMPSGLPGKIVVRITVVRRRRARLNALAFGAGSAVSLGCLSYAGLSFADNLAYSGFGDYLSLATDGATLAAWKELAWSLAESVPLAGSMTLLAAGGAFVWSSAKTAGAAGRALSA
jgi:hypothetical protein